MFCNVFFFFSSRRRHTRFDCDWSSDVCSSDLPRRHSPTPTLPLARQCPRTPQCSRAPYPPLHRRQHNRRRRLPSRTHVLPRILHLLQFLYFLNLLFFRHSSRAHRSLRKRSPPLRNQTPQLPHDQRSPRPRPGTQPPLQKMPATRHRPPIPPQTRLTFFHL